MKFIRKYGNQKYRIVKWKKIHKGRNKGKFVQKHFGSFNDLESAREYRDICVENNWHEKLMPKNNPNPLKYIYKNSVGHYFIGKRKNGKMEYYGTYSNIIDAINERDLLKKHNWSLEKVCECSDGRIAGEEVYLGRCFL